jgi:hypothetical protein
MAEQGQFGPNKIGWEMREVKGELVAAAGQRIVPVAQVARIHWPGGGIVWNHPAAVEVSQGDLTQRVPIPDVTLNAILAIGLAGAVVVAMAVVWSWIHKGRSSQ